MLIDFDKIIEQIEYHIEHPESFSYKLPIMNGLYNFKKGRTTYFAGIPSHGKSTFVFELLIQLTEKHGLKHVLVAPEEGTAAELYITILCMITGLQNRSNAFNRLTKEVFYKNIAYLKSHFHIYDLGEKSVSPYKILEDIKEYIIEHKIDTLTLDPWNELTHDFSIGGGRQDIYLEKVLGDIRLFSRANKIHTFIVAHPRTLQKSKDGGKYEPPTAYEFSGGGAWYAKADGIICVYRPEEFSEVFKEQTKVEIIIQKAKRGIGKKGIINLDFNLQTSRYIELDKPIENNFTAPF